MSTGIGVINDRVREESAFVENLRAEIAKVIVGQKDLVDRMMVGLLANGHLLLEGVPGLAKTLSIRTLASALAVSFQRIQFTPDLLPADIIGTQIYNPKEGSFSIRKGPVFANIVLADEINRAPAKVQSALLESMQERQVTIGQETFTLPEPFLVLATQNPIEQEGTYPLPEAQVDRFMLKLKVSYPSLDEERIILDRMASTQPSHPVKPVIQPQDLLRARKVVDDIYIDDKIKQYILSIIFATRDPAAYDLDLKPYLRYGASPRATIFLTLGAKAQAFLGGRGYVTPQDVKTIAMDVLRHRVLISYEAEAEELTPEHIIERILAKLPVP
ncbi:MAG TPA: MoxR family ATPase [Kiritimatiellia bacterium]|nr:MoxR family ATPase [Kiritimatiellia bacterium]